MTDEQREELKEAIQQRISRLKDDIKNLQDTSKPIAPDQSLGRLTRMDAMQIKHMQEANLITAQHNLCKLEESLKQIDNENFGRCSYCKNPIGFERIKALPETNKCIQCAEKYGN